MNVSVSYDKPCPHTAGIKIRTVTRPGAGCEECMKMGARWVALRECLSCGHIGCCDLSPNQHARAHFEATGHPIVTSAEVGQTWTFCYLDRRML
ncbi:MAG TPA: UBP-type zinc finger domain-containing protein [Labilithrix sp.]|jgi:uncharacterized UBP type Zn finger protein|nr:UBP-type zinc finger domain-containing protein [Labilithrix sp.]